MSSVVEPESPLRHGDSSRPCGNHVPTKRRETVRRTEGRGPDSWPVLQSDSLTTVKQSQLLSTFSMVTGVGLILRVYFSIFRVKRLGERQRELIQVNLHLRYFLWSFLLGCRDSQRAQGRRPTHWFRLEGSEKCRLGWLNGLRPSLRTVGGLTVVETYGTLLGFIHDLLSSEGPSLELPNT